MQFGLKYTFSNYKIRLWSKKKTDIYEIQIHFLHKYPTYSIFIFKKNLLVGGWVTHVWFDFGASRGF